MKRIRRQQNEDVKMQQKTPVWMFHALGDIYSCNTGVQSEKKKQLSH